MFGEPIAPTRGPGRPPLVWSQRISTKISLLFACGHSEKDVAAVIGYCTKTLRKVFSKEWAERRHARLKVRGEQLFRLNEQAIKGSVPAEKALAGMIQAESIQAAGARISQRAETPPPTRIKGKKEQAADAASSLSGIYATRAAPPNARLNS